MENLRKLLQLIRHLGFLALWQGLQARFGPGGRQSAAFTKFSEIYWNLVIFTKFH